MSNLTGLMETLRVHNDKHLLPFTQSRHALREATNHKHLLPFTQSHHTLREATDGLV